MAPTARIATATRSTRSSADRSDRQDQRQQDDRRGVLERQRELVDDRDLGVLRGPMNHVSPTEVISRPVRLAGS